MMIIMKVLKYTLPAIVLGTMVGCTNSKLERRIDKLEGRVAALEAANGISSSSAPTPDNYDTAQETKPEGPLPAFAFSEESHDFGTIEEGELVEHIFTFTNSGESPLIISNAAGSCGCTVPEYPKDPIGIGESGQIKVKFNSSGRPGMQNKTVTLTANTYPTETILSIKANVTPKPAEDNDGA